MEMKENTNCKNGCDRFNHSMYDVVKYATKNRDDLIAVKKIAEEQKIKIACLRGHRNQVQGKMEQVSSDHEEELIGGALKVSSLQKEMKYLEENFGKLKRSI